MPTPAGSVTKLAVALLALFMGFVLPVMLGTLWHDARGAFVWASLVKIVMGLCPLISSPPACLTFPSSLALHLHDQFVYFSLSSTMSFTHSLTASLIGMVYSHTLTRILQERIL